MSMVPETVPDTGIESQSGAGLWPEPIPTTETIEEMDTSSGE